MALSGGESDNMIQVTGAYKRYDEKTEVLRGLNMKVQRGTIYAFLGPSGSGKTTLLKCIVGRKRLDAGEIIVGVQHRSRMGYMPQETALLPDISIKETLSYFGWMYGLKGRELEKRKEELFDFLDIPQENKLIKNMSGGQQRRVSLCVALLNNPDLMILDEPTVGVDPLLSYSIWQCLRQMSSEYNKTILLTTHYIEEARQANKVGMMRGGCMLLEGEATTIMDQYKCNTLEQVFIQLSSEQDNNHSDEVKKTYPMPTVKPKLPFPEEKCFSMRNFISLLLKNFYFLKYSPIGWFLILFVPISASILFEIAFGQGTFNLKLGVINEEIGLNSCENYNSTCHLASCVYINLLRESQLNLIPYQDTINAYKDARRNLIWGYMYLPHNFTLSLYERIMRQEFVDDRTLEDSEVSVWIDMSNQVTGNHLKKSIYLAFNNFLKQLSSSCSLPVHHMRIPIRYNHPIYGSTVPNPNEYSIVGLLLMLEFYLPMTYGAALLDDKLEGILERGFIAGHTAIEMLVAHIFVTLVLFVISTSLLLTIFYGIFTHAFEGSVILALILLILIGIGGLFYGISVALLFDDYATATTFVLGTILPLTLLSGVIWPTEGMHYYLRSISSILPLTLPTEAYRSIAMRSWTLTHPSVYEGFFSCILWASVFCLATIFIIKNKTGIAVK